MPSFFFLSFFKRERARETGKEEGWDLSAELNVICMRHVLHSMEIENSLKRYEPEQEATKYCFERVWMPAFGVVFFFYSVKNIHILFWSWRAWCSHSLVRNLLLWGGAQTQGAAGNHNYLQHFPYDYVTRADWWGAHTLSGRAHIPFFDWWGAHRVCPTNHKNVC